MDGRLRVGGQDGIKSRSTITAITGLIPGSPMVPAIDAPLRGNRHGNQGVRGGGQGQRRTADTRIFSPRPGLIARYLSIGYRGARCVKCPTMHNGAGLIPANLPQGTSGR